MIHYHGTPVGGTRQDGVRFLAGRHALVPLPRKDDIGIVSGFANRSCSTMALSRSGTRAALLMWTVTLAGWRTGTATRGSTGADPRCDRRR